MKTEAQTEEIVILPSEASPLLVQIVGGTIKGIPVRGLLNEKITGAAKVKLGLIAKSLEPISDAIEKVRTEMIVAHGGDKERGIPAENKEGIKLFFLEYDAFTKKMDAEPETIKRKKISLSESGYLSIISDSDYSLAIEKLFIIDDQED
jgi:hypothetical protein